MTNPEFVRVFATDDLGRYLFARSLLDRDEIEYVAKGETMKGIDGWPPPGAIDVVLGPAELWVRAEDADRAVSLLRDLDSHSPG